MKNKLEIIAPHELAVKLMDSFFELYQYVAIGMGIDLENEEILQVATDEGVKFAQDAFCETVDKFESAFPGIELRWAYDENEEEEEDYY